jgi:L-ascorbate metabolism protein UlaG (beta-lactamase superfamily)
MGPEPARRTPPTAPVPRVKNDGSLLRAGSADPSLTWIGHATYLAQLGGKNIITDPVLSSRIFTVKRNVAPGIAHEDLPRIDIVCLSHNHYDHMDAPTLRRIGKGPTYLVPKGLASWFESEGLTPVVELEWWQDVDVDGVEVTFVPSQHWSRRGVFDMDTTLWGGFVIRGGGRSVYHSGDTAYFSGFTEIGKRTGPIDAAMLPIGAYDPRWFMKAQHMDPNDAVQAFVDLGAKRFFAMHWGTFKLTDEPLDEPPVRLRSIWTERGLDPAALSVPAIGETVSL